MYLAEHLGSRWQRNRCWVLERWRHYTLAKHFKNYVYDNVRSWVHSYGGPVTVTFSQFFSFLIGVFIMIILSLFYHPIMREADNFSICLCIIIWRWAVDEKTSDNPVMSDLSHVLELEWTVMCILGVRKIKGCAWIFGPVNGRLSLFPFPYYTPNFINARISVVVKHTISLITKIEKCCQINYAAK